MPRAAPLHADWRARLDHIVETMREMSNQTDPHAMVEAYGRRIDEVESFDRYVSISRRDLSHPWFRVTRDSDWDAPIDPWKERHRLPLLRGGLIAEMIYSNRPHLMHEPLLAPDDPARPYLDGYRTVIAVPHYDRGESLNMVLHLQREARGFDPEEFPELVWLSNLFGRATHNLVLSNQLRAAYQALDRELEHVAAIQRSLLPPTLPTLPGLDLAVSYQASRYAGGDMYDLFPMADGRVGIFMADASGHGTPAAVMMAILHALTHSAPVPRDAPADMLGYLNARLAGEYTATTGAFVTAFYGVYAPSERTITYSSAGHPPPRLVRAGSEAVRGLDEARELPLGVRDGQGYTQHTEPLGEHDILALYTDGITEAMNGTRELFGVPRLDAALSRTCGGGMSCPAGARAEHVLEGVLGSVGDFARGHAADDDRTLMVGIVR